jgi:Ca2+-binding RTX toxin-like protein
MNIVKISSSTTTFNAYEAETTYLVGKTVQIDAMGDGITLNGDAKYRALTVAGSLEGSITAVRIDEQYAPFGGVKVSVTETGTMTGGNYGMLIDGQGHSITNAGEINGAHYGMYNSGTNRVLNSGTIHGEDIGIQSNFGRGDGINLIVNKGTISGHDVAIKTSSEFDRIVNFGTIDGDVTLGAYDDTFVFKAGTVSGTVYGETGDDLYVINKAGLTIVEDFGEGVDRINSSVSITMPANVEKLYLTGKAAIDATGGTSGNWIYGNQAANRIDAGGGFDYIDGGKGNDILTGGSSGDDFHFARGSGKDIVTDFQAGFDEIEIGDLKGATDFVDMLANHVTEKGGDLWITYGRDIVILQDTAKVDLKGGDFDFG